jgi:heme/copper-type cytochrome/quinol oxidase subunit 4
MKSVSPPIIWVILVAITLLSWLAAEGQIASRFVASAVIIIAAFKINLVVGHFMELKWRPRPFRIIVTGWLMIVTTIIIVGQWVT